MTTHAPAQTRADKPHATVVAHRTVLSLNPRHDRVRAISRDVFDLHRFVMAGHTDNLIRGAGNVRQRMKILFAAQRAPAAQSSSALGRIRGLLIQSQAVSNWSEFTRDGIITAIDERELRYTLTRGDTIEIRTWANPVTSVRESGPPGVHKKSKTVPILDDTRAAQWIVRVMRDKGCEIMTESLRTGHHRTLYGGTNRVVTLRPYQFRAVVTDPHALANAIEDGIGRGKPYGAGLLDVTT